jgi:hypothetical protein
VSGQIWSNKRLHTFFEAGISLRCFVSFIWILWPIFWSEISKPLFVSLTKFLNPEPPFYAQVPKNIVPVLISIVEQIAASTGVSHVLAVSFFSLYTFICLAHFPAAI